MELRDLTRDLFLFAATFRERLERGQVSGVQALAQEVKGIFGRMDQKARENPAMSARYEKMRYGLVALIDEIVVSSTWPEAQHWPVLELELYQSNIAGDRVYDLIAGLTPADQDLIEGYFYVLALGFRGKHAFDESQWSEALLQLYRQLPEALSQTDVKLAPEAYNVIRRKARRLDPLFSLFRSAIVFFVCIILLVVFYQVVWLNSVNEVKRKTEEVRQGLANDELRRALEEVKR